MPFESAVASLAARTDAVNEVCVGPSSALISTKVSRSFFTGALRRVLFISTTCFCAFVYFLVLWLAEAATVGLASVEG